MTPHVSYTLVSGIGTIKLRLANRMLSSILFANLPASESLGDDFGVLRGIVVTQLLVATSLLEGLNPTRYNVINGLWELTYLSNMWLAQHHGVCGVSALRF